MGASVSRDGDRPGRDLPLGLGRAPPDRGSHGHRRGTNPRRRSLAGGRSSAGDGPHAVDRRCRRISRLAPGADGSNHRRTGWHPLRHPRTRQARRGHDRAAGRRRGHVLHPAVGGFQTTGADLVPNTGKNPVSLVGRSFHRLPRGRARAPSSAGTADLYGGRAQPVPARRRVRTWLLGGLGPLRRAPDG